MYSDILIIIYVSGDSIISVRVLHFFGGFILQFNESI